MPIIWAFYYLRRETHELLHVCGDRKPENIAQQFEVGDENIVSAETSRAQKIIKYIF
jgi:hypothetical protein